MEEKNFRIILKTKKSYKLQTKKQKKKNHKKIIPDKFSIKYIKNLPTKKRYRLLIQKGGFFEIFNFTNRAKLNEFKKKANKVLKKIQEKLKGVEVLGNIYKDYSVKRLKVVDELIIGNRAEVIFPMLKKKIETMNEDQLKLVAEKKDNIQISAKTFKSQLSAAESKYKNLKIKLETLINNNKILYDQLTKHKKEYDKEFKIVEKYMSDYSKVGNNYVKKVHNIVLNLESMKSEYDNYITIPEKQRTNEAKKAIKKFLSNEKTYKLMMEFGPQQLLDTIDKEKDRMVNFRTDMEHYNNEFNKLAPSDLKKWKDTNKDCTEQIYKSTKLISETKKSLKTIATLVERLYELSSMSQILSFSEKYKSFKEPIDKCTRAIEHIETQVQDIEQHFYNLVPAMKIDYNLQILLIGIRTIYVVLSDNIDKYINKEKTKIYDLPQ